MRRLITAPEPSTLRTAGLTFLLLLVALALGPLVGTFGFGMRELVILTIALLLATLLLIPNERVLKYGFYLWILTFGFGWRTIYLTPNLNVHPSEVAAVLLFVAFLAMSAGRRMTLDFSVPAFIPLLMLFCLLGVLTAIFRGTQPDVILEQSKVFFALIPVYYAVKWLVRTRQAWERAALLAVAVVVYVSCLGLMDYFAPGLSRSLSGSSSADPQFLAQSINNSVSFDRVGFIFYGSFTAGFLIFTFFGFSTYYFVNSAGKGLATQILAAAIILAELAAMYLSGYRGLWYAIGVFLVALAVVQRRGWLLAGAAIAAVPLLPANFLQRFTSLVNPQYADSSQYDRISRATYALDLIRQSPLTGVGWGGSGYVHSDLAQIGANLGLLALAIFTLWLLTMAWKMFRISRQTDWQSAYSGVLFASICGLLVLFAGEGQIAFVQLMIPIWFLFAMVHRLADFASEEQANNATATQGAE
ncbi:MAG: hypothetical protein M1570_00150 [Chloroflexi bacterium]|nr:hypothetical protein [Chloroflexota bacterium]